ncbi:MAG: hypothetical protein NT121_02630 [Chloroflexi bacterium]|nr:hypothetical protein [Chloroflexota bacterium]
MNNFATVQKIWSKLISDSYNSLILEQQDSLCSNKRFWEIGILLDPSWPRNPQDEAETIAIGEEALAIIEKVKQ